MQPQDYQRACLRTVSRELHFWKDDFDGDDAAARLAIINNCALGMCGESVEIHETPTSDEIGDGFWYAHVMLFALGESADAPDMRDFTRDQAMLTMWSNAGRCAEWTKKLVFHDRKLDDYRDGMIEATRSYIAALAALDAQTPAESMAQNIAKLKARWPGEFLDA